MRRIKQRIASIQPLNTCFAERSDEQGWYALYEPPSFVSLRFHFLAPIHNPFTPIDRVESVLKSWEISVVKHKKMIVWLPVLLTLATFTGCQNGPGFSLSNNPMNYFSNQEADEELVDSEATVADSDTAVEYQLASAESIQEKNSRPMETLVVLQRTEDLENYLNGSHERVLLDFYADWCGPCRQQGQILNRMQDRAAETGTLIVKIDIDDHPKLASEYMVVGVPALILASRGQIVEKHVGVADQALLTSWMTGE